MTRQLSTNDVTWFLDLFDKQQLDLDPPYQRRSVWSPKDRRFFIDTILNNYPAPPIFLHKTLDENGKATYHVVDGKQRLQTIIMFRDNKLAIPEDFNDVNLQRKKWKDIDRGTKEKFWNYVLISELLPDAHDAAIRNTFERINRNSRKLTPQELRHAKYDGWFICAVENEADDELWKSLGLVTTARSKRMQDAQFLSELFAVAIRLEVKGFDQDDLDNLYADYDEIEGNDLFVEDDFRTEVDCAKATLRDMLAAKPHLRDYLKAQGNLFSLWAALALEREKLPPAAELADRYLAFMQAVSARLADPNAPAGQDDFEVAVAQYAADIRGASTDQTPRLNRHTALVGVLSAAGVQ